MKTFSDQLRDAIRRSGKSQYSICAETGILKSTMSRFVRGECGLGVDAIDRVCKCIGARLAMNQPCPIQKRKRK
jgi:transcriptional regulator with XRE-family HTH domain